MAWLTLSNAGNPVVVFDSLPTTVTFGLVSTACCPNPNSDGRDHPVADGAFFLALILTPILMWIAVKVFLWRASRRRPPE